MGGGGGGGGGGEFGVEMEVGMGVNWGGSTVRARVGIS